MMQAVEVKTQSEVYGRISVGGSVDRPNLIHDEFRGGLRTNKLEGNGGPIWANGLGRNGRLCTVCTAAYHT